MVRSVKSSLRKTLGTKSLPRAELETALHEVEACVNSRPLTFLGDETDDVAPLTPSCFLIGQKSVYGQRKASVPEVEMTRTSLENKKFARDSVVEKFWCMWSQDYIRSLPVWKGGGQTSDVDVGSLVLIREDGYPRLKWPLGVVVETYPGRDGIVRTCKVKTKRGNVIRAIQRLHDLEVTETKQVPKEVKEVVVNAKENTTEDIPKQIEASRSGRLIKPAQKLNL